MTDTDTRFWAEGNDSSYLAAAIAQSAPAWLDTLDALVAEVAKQESIIYAIEWDRDAERAAIKAQPIANAALWAFLAKNGGGDQWIRRGVEDFLTAHSRSLQL